ncbi:MAG: NAD-dependent succinate-semialdehyde dehydrogenase [Nannocystaceae bacterium]|nr:NAD-dependent succinate-semialdehyde dehydrogenase [Nannocystaceae bacterium]
MLPESPPAGTTVVPNRIGIEQVVEGDVCLRVTDPGTDDTVGWVPYHGEAIAREAVDAAAAALPAWRARPPGERADCLRRFAASMLAQQRVLARQLTREQGKPLTEAMGEIAYAASFLEWSAEEGRRLAGEWYHAHHSDKRILVLRQPLGVVAAITPWNFPAAMVTRKLGPALAVGCTVVLKPAEQAPLTALALAELALQAGIPPGVFNVVTGDADAIGRAWLGDARVRKLSFTGSTEVGRLLVARAATQLTRLSLELGGHAPLLVFEDADLDAAVRGAIAAKFRNAGQTCICPNRAYVHAAVADAFVARVRDQVAGMFLGHGLDDGVQVGPLIDDDAVAKVRAHLDDARDRGATVQCGGNIVQPRFNLTHRFCEPTVLTGLDPAMAIAREETFGPVLAVQTFEDDDHAIALANDTPWGLAAYAYTRELSRALRVAEALEFGIVGLNDTAVSNAQAPFGGLKHSGWGREGGKWGVEDYVDVKYVSIG